METYGSTSDPDRILDPGPENDGEFHFDYSTVEASDDTRPTSPPSLAPPDEPATALRTNFLEGDSLTFYETIPSLQEISSSLVAVTLWRQVLGLPRNGSLDSVTKIDRRVIEKLLLELPVPRVIREIVEISVRRAESEMEDWLCYYRTYLFTVRWGAGEGTTNTGDLLFCCWLANGKIDHRKTAVNMLSNPRLFPLDKFKIMARYCLADELEKSSAEPLPSYFTKRTHFSKNALLYYWLCYKEGVLDQVPRQNGESIESYLITAFNADTWSAIEYFWDRLSVHEQTSKIEQLLNQRPQFQKNFFFKMNESQKFHILSKMPVKIMKNFWTQPGQTKFALVTWRYIRNFVDYEQFVEMIKTLTRESSSFVEEKIKCLVDIWNACPVRLKNLAYESTVADMVVNFHIYNWHNPPCDNIDFLLAFLSYLEVEPRKRFLFDRADALVLMIDESATDELIKLCLPNAKDASKFRNYVLESSFIHGRLCDELHENNFDRLYRVLNYYCPDSNRRARSEFCCKILESFDVRGCPFYDVDKWVNVVQFIDENILLESPDQALKFKKRLARSFASFCCELWSEQDDMAKMIRVVDQVLDAEELALFKVNALKRVQTRYRWGKFDEKIIGGFLSWCCDNDGKKVREFVKTLSIDGIFEYAWHSLKWTGGLQNEMDRETICEFFEPLDRCLLWYFGSLHRVKEYKLEKVFAYRYQGKSMFLQYLNKTNNIFTKNTLPWFFDGDRDAIELFKQRYKFDDIGQMI